ncbi:hypothetical protein HRJ34_21170 [Rhizorhabdus wittichii]|uniref:Uncharacterized protein n=1 Tax=Rhizorhabdus wittichii TaxID=160791 RepID=A0A975D197_9SPHN|nr:hypothetical protein [Rhizorhabdus wittichii]QTH20809.1 hypothetical protein HRJ34_21170 [Rhizorhabdus wittichii]
MTAINVLLQPTAAYLITDSATTDSNGVLIDIRSKVTVLSRFRAAIAWTGAGPIHAAGQADRRISEALVSKGVSSQAELLAALPLIAAEMHAENAAYIDTGHDTAVSVFVALWSKKRREPQLWACHGDQSVFGPSYVPYSMVRLRQYVTCPPDVDPDGWCRAAFGRVVDFADPKSFRPSVDGVALLEAQRHIREGIGVWGGYSVGGSANLTTVSAKGIRERVLKTWPDKVGEKISPAVT